MTSPMVARSVLMALLDEMVTVVKVGGAVSMVTELVSVTEEIDASFPARSLAIKQQHGSQGGHRHEQSVMMDHYTRGTATTC